MAHGSHNQLWTADRVREVMRRRFGVTYNAGYVARILTHRLGWTPQRPEHRHADRDDLATHD